MKNQSLLAGTARLSGDANASTLSAMNLLASLLVFIFMNNAARAEDIYVDASKGSDNNPGTITSPWKSLDKVSAFTFSPGDNVYLKRGETWHESLILSESGTADQPITLGAYTDPEFPSTTPPVISCARDITDILWQGILANGGFNDTGAKSDPIFKLCNCPSTESKSRNKCADSNNTFPGWHSKGSGKTSVTQDATGSNLLTGSPKGPTAKLESTNNFINLTSNAFSLRPHGTENTDARFVISGYIRAMSGSRVDIALYTAGTEKYHLDDTGKWSAWSVNKSRKPFFITEGTDSWEYFEVPFNLQVKVEQGNSASIDSGNTRVTISVRGNGHVTGWADDIKLIDRSRDYWTANTIDRHNPHVLIENGVRLARGTTEWDPGYKWHAGNQHVVRYIPDTPFTAEETHIEVGQRMAGIKLIGTEHIRIEDVVIRGCEGTLKSSACDGAALHVGSGSSNNTLMGITVANNDYGVRVEGNGPKGENRNNVFSNIIADNNRSGGIALRNHATGNIIRDCKINNTGMLDTDGEGQDIEPVSLGGGTGLGPGNIVEDCEIINSRTTGKKSASGIIAFNSPRTIIRNNYLYNIGRSGIIMAAGSHNSEIYKNIINGTGKSPESATGAGIDVVAEGTDFNGIRIYNNTVYDCTNNRKIFGGITLRGRNKCQSQGCAEDPDDYYKVRNALVTNNIVYGCYGKYPIAYYAANIDFSSLTSDHNLFYRKDKGQGGAFILFQGGEYTSSASKYRVWTSLLDFKNDKNNKSHLYDQNSKGTNPQLIDTENANFQPGKNSPVTGAGKNVDAGDGKSANTPNIGAL